MKKIKSKFLLGFALLLATISLSGCGTNAAKPNFEVPEGGYNGSEVTIKFYHTMGANLTKVLDEYITAFNGTYPNIKVEYTSVGSYDDVRDQIKTEISIGEQPNIAYCYPDHVALYNKAKAVASLDNLINDSTLGFTQAQKDDFIEGYYNEGKQFGDGLMYSLPFSKSTEVLYYNKSFFTKNNLTVPTTWDEVEAVCKKIKEIDPKSTPLGYDSEANWFITMCEQTKAPYTSATAPHFLFNNDKAKAFVNRFKDWYDKGYVTTEKVLGAYTSGLFTTTDEVKSYMSIGSSAGATYQRPAKVNGEYPFEVGIASIPQVDAANNPKVISQGPSVCIFKNEDPQKVVASWLFVKYLTTSVEFQAEFGIASGYVPVLKSVTDNETYKAKLATGDGGDGVAYLSAKVCLDQKNYYYTSPAFIGSSTARDQVGELLVAVMSGAKTTDKAFSDAIAECEYQAG